MLTKATDNPVILKITKALMAVLVSVQLYMLFFSATSPGILHPIHVFFYCLTVYLCFPKPGKTKQTIVMWWVIDTILMIGVIASTVFILLNHNAWINRYTTTMTDTDVFFSVIMALFILVMVQRLLGLPMVILCIIFFSYALFGHNLSGTFRILPISWKKIFGLLYNIQGAYFGSLTGTCVRYVLPFVIMGKIMELCGTGDYFTEFANRLTGKSRGGPAKVAVVSTAIFGTISGAGAANCIATGTFSIPLMKKAGYESKFAAGIEAVAAAGGQIMPPIMAAAAFLAAEMSGIPYTTLAVSAIIPALLYYINLFITLDFEAGRLKLGSEANAAIKPWETVLSRGYLLLPVIAIILALLILRASPLRACGFAMTIGILLFYVNPKTRLPFKKSLVSLFNTFYSSAIAFVSIGLAFGCAAMVSSIMNATGLAVKFSSLIFSVGKGNALLSLILAAIITTILGMGLPVSAAYIIAASVCVAPLLGLGLPLLAVHMFLLHVSSLSSITPPVCITAYTAAGISGDNPMAVGFTACRIGIISFLIPFFFAFDQAMLLTINGIGPGIQSLITGVLGIVALAAGNVGWFRGTIKWPIRVLLIVSGFLMIDPSIFTDIFGIGIMAVSFIIHLTRNRESIAG